MGIKKGSFEPQKIILYEDYTMYTDEMQMLSNKDLTYLKWIAEETQDGKWIKAIRYEQNRRVREQ